MLFQYPIRPLNRPYGTGQMQKSGDDFKLTLEKQILLGERVSTNLHVEKPEDDFRKTTEEVIIQPNYYTAVQHQGGFVLTPVASIVQFRPNFEHISFGTEDKTVWKPVRVNQKEQAEIAADELLKPNIEESFVDVGKSGYLDDLAPLCNESLENDFSTC